MSPNDHSRLVSSYETVSPVAPIITKRFVRYLTHVPWEFFFGHNCPGCDGGNIPPLDCVTCGPMQPMAYSQGPAPRTEFQAVYSRAAARRYVLVADGIRPLIRWYGDGSQAAGNFGTDGKDMVWTRWAPAPLPIERPVPWAATVLCSELADRCATTQIAPNPSTWPPRSDIFWCAASFRMLVGGMMRHRVAWSTLVLAFATAPWLLLHAGCGKGEVETSQPGKDAGAGGTEGGSFDVFTELPATPNCDDPTDSDGDNVADELEGAPSLDTDGDTVPDYLDDDSDGDGTSDADEAANPFLEGNQAGKVRDNPCATLADSDGDGIPDLRDVDSDGDGIADEDEAEYDPDGSLGCRVKPDCDEDGVVDPVELAAGSDVLDPDSIPPDATLYFVLPYEEPEKQKDFEFSAGVKKADVYFLVDTTESMQAAIDNVASSLDSTILPAILNGDPTASPAIPAIPGAWVGVGAFRDVPWAPWGATTDELYESRFDVAGSTELGNLAEPESGSGGLVAPASVRKILGSLQAAGGGDAPEGLTQALWMAASGGQYAATLGGLWTAPAPSCVAPGELGLPCFRPGALPVFVLITDAPMHNGPVAGYDYTTATTGGTKSYTQALDAMNALGAKVVGVSVNTGTPGVARADLEDLAEKTGSLWYDPAFGGNEYPLVTEQDTATGDVSSEVVRLIGLLAGQGLNNVTTLTRSYSCAGGVDCDGDGAADPAYENAVVPPESEPFDAAKMILDVEPVASSAVPLPYAELDATTFYGVRGDATVSFRVHARNTVLKPPSMMVLRALIRVQTPKGQQLGGASGVKVVYLVIPRYVQQTF